MNVGFSKRSVAAYYIAGTVLSVLIFANIVLAKYVVRIDAEIENLGMISAKVGRMEESMGDEQTLLSGIMKDGIGPSGRARVRMLESLDAIKGRFDNSILEVDEAFKDDGVALMLGFVIKGSLADYAAFVRNISYLESMSLPWIIIKSTGVEREEEGSYGYTLNGVVIMPTEGNS